MADETNDDRFRVVFRGMWHGYNSLNHVHAMNAEEYADVGVTDEGNCMRIDAGCRSEWFTHETAYKVGAALLAGSIRALQKKYQPLVFVLTPNRKTLKEVVLTGDERIILRNGSIIVNGKYRSLKVWKLSVRKNPDLEDVEKELTAQRAVLASAVRSLVKAARGSGNPAIEAAAKRLYDNANMALSGEWEDR